MKFAHGLVIALLLSPLAATAAPKYRLVELPGLSQARAISANGTIAGEGPGADRQWHALTWKDGLVRDLGPGRASAVNDQGDAVGVSNNGAPQAWIGGTTATLPFGGAFTGINNAGTAVGYRFFSDASGFNSEAFAWTAGNLSVLPGRAAVAINDSNQILVGDRADRQGGGFIYQDGRQTAVPIADSITANGAVGGTLYSQDGRRLPAVYKDGKLTLLETATNAFSAYINDRGDAVGMASNYDSVDDYVFADGRAIPVRQLLDRPTAFSLVRINAINERGWIVGWAEDLTANRAGAVLLVPVGDEPPLALMHLRKTDLDADRKGDLLWQHPTGSNGGWLMDGLSRKQAVAFEPPPNATVVLAADLDGNGTTDLLWKSVTGAYYLSLAAGVSLNTQMILPGGSGWSLVGAGDFDGDHMADLLWYDADHDQYSAWMMNGTAVKSSLVVPAPAGAKAAVIADLDGDGKDEIVFRTAGGGFIAATINGSNPVTLGTIREDGTGFQPIALGDFNADGKTDIVWAHPDGRQSLWLMNGAAMVNSVALPNTSSGWTVAFTADLDGNGTDDLAWKHADGSIGAWLMSGTHTLAYAALLGPNTGWRPHTTTDLDGDGKRDLVLRHDSGAYGAWLMDGLTIRQAAMLLDGGTGWEITP